MVKDEKLKSNDLENDVLNENLPIENRDSIETDPNQIKPNGISQIDTSMLDEIFDSKQTDLEKQYTDQLIDEANRQKEIERQRHLFEKEFKKISDQLSPLYDLFFSLVNTILSAYKIKPLEDHEKKQIQVVIYDFTSQTITQNIEKAENLVKNAKTMGKWIRLGNMIITIVIPRVLEKFAPKE